MVCQIRKRIILRNFVCDWSLVPPHFWGLIHINPQKCVKSHINQFPKIHVCKKCGETGYIAKDSTENPNCTFCRYDDVLELNIPIEAKIRGFGNDIDYSHSKMFKES